MKTRSFGIAAFALTVAIGSAYASISSPFASARVRIKTNLTAGNYVCRTLTNSCSNSGAQPCQITVFLDAPESGIPRDKTVSWRKDDGVTACPNIMFNNVSIAPTPYDPASETVIDVL